MAWFPSIGASLTRPTSPAITFMDVKPVLSLGLLLLEANKNAGAAQAAPVRLDASVRHDRHD